ncbi:MAG: transposase [Patescibacteria group bacterium]
MAKPFCDLYRAESARLPRWDYAENGDYFVTICTRRQENYFGVIQDKRMRLSKIGKVAEKFWCKIPRHFPFVQLDHFVVMPNHIHGIITIAKDLFDPRRDAINRYGVITHPCRDAIYRVSTENRKTGGITGKHNPMGKKSLGEIIREYKSAVKRFSTRDKIPFAWQRLFYDRVIRNDRELTDIQAYIINNHANWERDMENLKKIDN